MAPPSGSTAPVTKAQPPRPRVSAREATIATVLVGPDQISFAVHESLLIHYSKSFRAALTGNFSEARYKTVKLADENADVFELFVHWLYYQRFLEKTAGDDEGLWELWLNKDFADAGTDQCIQLYVLAIRPEEYGCIPFLQGVWQRYATASIEAMKAGATDVLEEDLDVCDYHDHNRDEGRVVCKNKRKQSAKCECNKDSA